MIHTPGMVPAINTDVSPSFTRCDFSKTDAESDSSYLVSQMFLSTILPYLVPFLCLLYPMHQLTSIVSEIDDHQIRNDVQTILIVVWSHIVLR